MIVPTMLGGEVPLILSTYSQICLLVHIQRDRDTERDTYTERERERVENKCAYMLTICDS